MTRVRLPERIRGLSLDLGNTLYAYRTQEERQTVRRLHRFLEKRLAVRLSCETLTNLYMDVRARQMAENLPTLCENDFDVRLREMLTHAHRPPASELVREASDAYGIGFVETLCLPAGMRETVARLSRRFDGRIAVCSNFMLAEPIRAVLRRDGLMPYLKAAVISRDIGFVKPHASVFAAVCDMLELDPSEIAHVGDNLEADIIGGKRAGMTTIFTTEFRDPAAPTEIAAAAPDFTIERLSELV